MVSGDRAGGGGGGQGVVYNTSIMNVSLLQTPTHAYKCVLYSIYEG